MTRSGFLELAAKDYIVKKYGSIVAQWPDITWWTTFNILLSSLRQASETTVIDMKITYGITEFDDDNKLKR